MLTKFPMLIKLIPCFDFFADDDSCSCVMVFFYYYGLLRDKRIGIVCDGGNSSFSLRYWFCACNSSSEKYENVKKWFC